MRFHPAGPRPIWYQLDVPQGYPTTDWDTQLSGFLRQRDSGGLHASFPFFLDPGPNDQAGMDFYSSPGDTGVNTAPPISQGPIVEAIQNQPDSRPSSSAVGSKHSTSTEARYYVDGTGARAPFGGKSKHRYSIANIGLLHHGDATDPSTSSVPNGIVSLAPNNAMLDGIQSECRLQEAHSDRLPLPSYSQVQFFVRQYFDNFHPIFPFLQRSAFSHSISQDWVLLLAVSAVGSRYTRRLQGQQPSDFLLDILRKILRCHMYELDADGDISIPFTPGNHSTEHTASPRIQTLQAGLLVVLCMLHCGKKAYLDLAFVDRHYLVEACNKLGLLSPRPPTTSTHPEATFGPDGTGGWTKRESRIRTGMMIWVFWFSLRAYLTRGKG